MKKYPAKQKYGAKQEHTTSGIVTVRYTVSIGIEKIPQEFRPHLEILILQYFPLRLLCRNADTNVM